MEEKVIIIDEELEKEALSSKNKDVEEEKKTFVQDAPKHQETSVTMTGILYLISAAFYIGGFIFGCYIGNEYTYYGFNWMLSFSVWLSSLFLGSIPMSLGKIIYLLKESNEKK